MLKRQFGQDGKFDTRLGGLETLGGLGDLEDWGSLEGLGGLDGLWGFGSSWKSQRSERSRRLGRFKRNMTYGPGGLNGTEGQGHSEVIGIRKRPVGTGRSGRFRRFRSSEGREVQKVWEVLRLWVISRIWKQNISIFTWIICSECPNALSFES